LQKVAARDPVARSDRAVRSEFQHSSSGRKIPISRGTLDEKYTNKIHR
jgi:hypothetical protein